MVLLLPWVVGCQGCRDDGTGGTVNNATDAEPFTFAQARPMPHSSSPARDRVKPGHWTSTSIRIRSNREDVRGTLRTTVGGTWRNSSGIRSGETTMTSSDSPIRSVRPVVMPKGQRRRFDFRLLPVGRPGTRRANFQFFHELESPAISGNQIGGTTVPGLQSAEYFFVILSTQESPFGTFDDSDWATPPPPDGDPGSMVRNYHVVRPTTDGVLPLGESMLDWTSIGVVLWDDLPPEALTPDQMQAMEDWLHFGGRLIVNGPAASEQIDQTLLADYLAIAPEGNVELDLDAAAEILDNYAVADDSSTEGQRTMLLNNESRVGLAGELNEDATSVEGTGSQVAVRQIGRGTVVQTRFDLASPWIDNWRSYPSFFSGVMLGRPPRRYIRMDQNNFGDEFAIESIVQDAGGGYAALDRDNTNVRLAVRDLSFNGTDFRNSAGSIGAWNADSDVIVEAVETLRQESGIEIPHRSLVVNSLFWYLLILVPVNYVVFRLMRRLEWAWLAVPVIAIGGAIWIARAAQLDIGFARSLNEIAFVEVPRGYRRGHVTHVTSIYNSLSSRYRIDFETPSAAATPTTINSADAPGESARLDFVTDAAEGPSLTDFNVASNQVRMAYAEEIADLGGPIRMENQRVINGTVVPMRDAVVVRNRDGLTEMAYLGDFDPESAATPQWQTGSVSVPKDLPVGVDKLMRRLLNDAAIAVGEVRLIARTDDSVGSMQIQPVPSQGNRQTVVMVHLEHQPIPKPTKDANLPSRVKPEADLL